MGTCGKKWKGQDTLVGERGHFFSTSKEPSQTDWPLLPTIPHSMLVVTWQGTGLTIKPFPMASHFSGSVLSLTLYHELIFVCSYKKSLQGKMDVFKVPQRCESSHFPYENFSYIPWTPLTSWLPPKKLSIPLPLLRTHIALLSFLLSRLKSLP